MGDGPSSSSPAQPLAAASSRAVTRQGLELAAGKRRQRGTAATGGGGGPDTGGRALTGGTVTSVQVSMGRGDIGR